MVIAEEEESEEEVVTRVLGISAGGRMRCMLMPDLLGVFLLWCMFSGLSAQAYFPSLDSSVVYNCFVHLLRSGTILRDPGSCDLHQE